jgi:hypothetical protein
MEVVGRRFEKHAALDLLRCFKGTARSRRRAAACPCHDILFEPNGAGAKPRNGLGEIGPLCVACRRSLRDTKQFRHLSQSQELERHRRTVSNRSDHRALGMSME